MQLNRPRKQHPPAEQAAATPNHQFMTHSEPKQGLGKGKTREREASINRTLRPLGQGRRQVVRLGEPDRGASGVVGSAAAEPLAASHCGRGRGRGLTRSEAGASSPPPPLSLSLSPVDPPRLPPFLFFFLGRAGQVKPAAAGSAPPSFSGPARRAAPSRYDSDGEVGGRSRAGQARQLEITAAAALLFSFSSRRGAWACVAWGRGTEYARACRARERDLGIFRKSASSSRNVCDSDPPGTWSW
jgi:hypothetical protein